MTLTATEWYLRIENETAAWDFDTFEGDAVPTAPVWITADAFAFVWSFQNEVAPGALEPCTFQFSLSCATPADVPDIDHGDLLVAKLVAPDAPVTRDGSGVATVTGTTILEVGFWVTDADLESDAGRLLLKVTATTAADDLNSLIDLDAFVASSGHTDFSDLLAETGMPQPWEAAAQLGESLLAAFRVASPDDGSLSGFTGPGVVASGTAVRFGDLLAGTAALWYRPPGGSWPDGFAFLWQLAADGSLLPPGYSGGGSGRPVLYPAKWEPLADAAGAAAPFELTYVGSVLAAEVAPSYGELQPGATIAFLDACYIDADPEWRKAAASAVNQVTYKGVNRSAGYPATDAQGYTVTSLPAPGASSTRDIESMNQVRNSVNPALGFVTYGGRESADRAQLTFARGAYGWAFDQFAILPRFMSDDQWQAFATMIWPLDRMQQTWVLGNVDPELDLTGGPMWMTVLGLAITARKGHLGIVPTVRNFFPSRITNVGDAVTWTELDTAYPTADWSDAAELLTWSQVGLASV